MAFLITQPQLDSAIDAAITRYNGKKISYAKAYPGECLSLNKQILTDITGLLMPGAINNYFWSDSYWIYFLQSLPLPSLFSKTAYTPGANYPKGSQVFYAATHHIATWLYDNGNGTHTVFEQNADPDGSPAHIAIRSNNKITGILVPIVLADSAPIAGGKGADTTRGDAPMIIQNADNWYGRCSKTMLQIRGYELTREDFVAHAVGNEFLHWVEAVEDDPAADAAYQAQTVGQTALRDNWEKQISDLTAVVAQRDATIKQDSDTIASLQIQTKAAVNISATLPSTMPTIITTTSLPPSVPFSITTTGTTAHRTATTNKKIPAVFTVLATLRHLFTKK